jgi:hypothetical protein
MMYDITGLEPQSFNNSEPQTHNAQPPKLKPLTGRAPRPKAQSSARTKRHNGHERMLPKPSSQGPCRQAEPRNPNSKPETRNPKPETRNPKPETRKAEG